MQSPNESSDLPNPESNRLEDQLRALQPKSCGVSRDRLMFLAGRQSAAGSARTAGWRHPAWLVAACALMLASVAWLRPDREHVVERVVYRDPIATNEVPLAAGAKFGVNNQLLPDRPDEMARPVTQRNDQRNPETSYITIRNVALEQGLDALPSPHVGGGGASEPRDYLRWRQQLSISTNAL